MLLAVTLLALAGLWWLGRGNRFPAGLTPQRLVAGGLGLVATLMLARGQWPLAAGLALASVWAAQGPGGAGRAVRRWLGQFRPDRAGGRAGLIAFEGAPGGVPEDGVVLAGPLRGARLSAMTRADLAWLHRACRAADPAAAVRLEAYLDGRHAGWRVHAEADADARPGRPLQPGAMTEQEAYQVLGLERGASLDQVRAAHRSLMKRAHPDQGGSAEDAARVNAARDRLVDRHR